MVIDYVYTCCFCFLCPVLPSSECPDCLDTIYVNSYHRSKYFLAEELLLRSKFHFRRRMWWTATYQYIVIHPRQSWVAFIIETVCKRFAIVVHWDRKFCKTFANVSILNCNQAEENIIALSLAHAQVFISLVSAVCVFNMCVLPSLWDKWSLMCTGMY